MLKITVQGKRHEWRALMTKGKITTNQQFTLLRQICREESNCSNTAMPLHVSYQVRAIPSIHPSIHQTQTWDDNFKYPTYWEADWLKALLLSSRLNLLLIGDPNKTSLAKSTCYYLLASVCALTAEQYLYSFLLLRLTRCLGPWHGTRYSLFSKGKKPVRKSWSVNLQTLYWHQ